MALRGCGHSRFDRSHFYTHLSKRQDHDGLDNSASTRAGPDHDASHEYTFSRNGDICFHSEPMPLDMQRTTLQEFIEEIVRNANRQDQGRFNDGRYLFKVIPELFQADWQSRNLRSTIKSYLVELDLLPATWNGNLFNFVFEDMDTAGRFLLAEALMDSSCFYSA